MVIKSRTQIESFVSCQSAGPSAGQGACQSACQSAGFAIESPRPGHAVIAVCGDMAVGKTNFIRALCPSAPQAEKLKTGVSRYVLSDVDIYEINSALSAKSDFQGVTAVVILFYHSVDKLAWESAKRAHERSIPLVFVATKSDIDVRRVLRLSGEKYDDSEEHDFVAKVRALVNTNAVKDWYSLPETQRRVYVVSNLALAGRAKRMFDEDALIRKWESLKNQVSQDVGSDEYFVPVGDVSGSCRIIPNTLNAPMKNTAVPKTMLQSSKTLIPPGTKVVCSQQSYLGSRMRYVPDKASASYKWQNPKPHQETRVCFLEFDNTKVNTTLMECLLGNNSPSTTRTIMPRTPYQHPNYGNAFFYFLPVKTTSVRNINEFFDATSLHTMTLVVVSYAGSFKSTLLQIVKECKKQSVEVVVVERKSEEPSLRQRLLRSRYNARKELNKQCLLSVCVFSINLRSLRMGDNAPHTDEQDFRNYITSVCFGKTPLPRRRAYSIQPSTSPDNFEAPPRYGNEAFTARAIFKYEDDLSRKSAQLLGSLPKKPALRSTTHSISSDLKTVNFQCGKDTLIAFVGAEQTGKTTMIANTLGIEALRPRIPTKSWHVRHPEFFDVVFIEMPGYRADDPNIVTWMQKRRLHTMDWIVLVFNHELTQADLSVMEFAEENSISVYCVCTKADVMVTKIMHERQVSEAEALRLVKDTITRNFECDIEEYNLRKPSLFILSAQHVAQDDESQALDEAAYLHMLNYTIACRSC